jgi:very-short-patch-repair endonuclease
LEQVLARADRQRLLDREKIETLLARYPRRRGRARLSPLLTNPASPSLTRSEAEDRFLTLVRKAGLRQPETNVLIRDFEVDALWRAERLVVEIDGFAFHSSPEAFERDRQRDGVLAAAGFRVMRTTWRQLTSEPEALLVRLAQALVARSAP